MTLNWFNDYQELFSGCVGYWDGSNFGTSYLDLIGNNNGTIVNAAKTGTDRFGTANTVMQYDGSSYVSLNGSSAFNFTTAFTVFLWIKSTSQPGSVIIYRVFSTLHDTVVS